MLGLLKWKWFLELDDLPLDILEHKDNAQLKKMFTDSETESGFHQHTNVPPAIAKFWNTSHRISVALIVEVIKYVRKELKDTKDVILMKIES